MVQGGVAQGGDFFVLQETGVGEVRLGEDVVLPGCRDGEKLENAEASGAGGAQEPLGDDEAQGADKLVTGECPGGRGG